MNKKKLIGLISLICIIVASMFISIKVLIGDRADNSGKEHNQISEDIIDESGQEDDGDSHKADDLATDDSIEGNDSTNSNSDTSNQDNSSNSNLDNDSSGKNNANVDKDNDNSGKDNANVDKDNDNVDKDSEGDPAQDTLTEGVFTKPDLGLIIDSTAIDYEAYIPGIVYTSQMEVALDIANPNMKIAAESAILMDLETKEVLYYKNAAEPVFPASTSKLLTCLVALDICAEDEQVIVGEEIDYMASDSSRAYLKKGQILTIRNLLEGMLLPSGNDAAYVTAVYVGRKSLGNPKASGEAAVLEFVRLMNEMAKDLGADNSCFKTPDGYDAIGQYTTAYDMGLIGLAAVENETIIQISKKRSSRNIFVSGEDITWENSNNLVNKNDGGYYQYAIGLKTGSSTMAGKCLIGAAYKNDRTVICVIMNSTPYSRYEDAISLLKYGLQ